MSGSGSGLSTINGIEPRFELKHGRLTEKQIINELITLRTGSITYNNLLKELPAKYNGVSVKNIIFTDQITFSNGGSLFAEKVAEGAFWFNRLEGSIYVYINPNQYLVDKASGRSMSLGETITHELGHGTERAYHTSSSEEIATAWGNGIAREQNLPEFSSSLSTRSLKEYRDRSEQTKTLYYDKARCFVGKTQIDIGEGAFKDIESIEVGDTVVSYPSDGRLDTSKLESKVVTKIFRNITSCVIDLRGLQCTPGHVFLRGERSVDEKLSYASITSILQNDGTLVDRNGVIIRARTGATVGQIEDAKVNISFFDENNLITNIVVRCGIPTGLFNLIEKDNRKNLEKLSDRMQAAGVVILAGNILLTSTGEKYSSCDWPEGSTPFDTLDQRNWIVEVNGQSYTPPWIADLTETDEMQSLRVAAG